MRGSLSAASHHRTAAVPAMPLGDLSMPASFLRSGGGTAPETDIRQFRRIAGIRRPDPDIRATLERMPSTLGPLVQCSNCEGFYARNSYYKHHGG